MHKINRHIHNIQGTPFPKQKRQLPTRNKTTA